MLKRGGAKDPWDDLQGNWTWPDLLDMAKKVTRVSGGNDEAWGVELDYVRPWYQNSGFVWTNGREADRHLGQPDRVAVLEYTFADPRTVEGLQLIYDLVHTHRVAITKEKAAELTKATPNLFSAQRTGMFENSSGGS